jgi:hypothetical protein
METEPRPGWDFLTLDTCCVSALANPQETNDPFEVSTLEQIVALACDGVIRIQITTACERDSARWKDPVGRETRLTWLASASPILCASGVFRLNVSAINGRDVLGNEADMELDQKLRRILLPSRAATSMLSHEEEPETTMKLFSDIDHLMAHWRSRADAFLTLDASTILKRNEMLRDLGIVACKPSEGDPLSSHHLNEGGRR